MQDKNPFMLESCREIPSQDFIDAQGYLLREKQKNEFKRKHPDLYELIHDIYFFDYTYWASDSYHVYRHVEKQKDAINDRIDHLEDKELAQFLKSCFTIMSFKQLKSRFPFVENFGSIKPYLVDWIKMDTPETYLNQLYTLGNLLKEKLMPHCQNHILEYNYKLGYTNGRHFYSRYKKSLINEGVSGVITINPNLYQVFKCFIKVLERNYITLGQLINLQNFKIPNFKITVRHVVNNVDCYIIKLGVCNKYYTIVYYP